MLKTHSIWIFPRQVPAIPSPAELEAASAKSPLKHPGDTPIKARIAGQPSEGAKASKPRKSQLMALFRKFLLSYIRGTARKSVLSKGPEQTFCQKLLRLNSDMNPKANTGLWNVYT